MIKSSKHIKDNEIAKVETSSGSNAIYQLKSEIRLLEQELIDLKQKIQPFQNLIYNQLHNEIRLLAELSELHKKYRTEKKQKRLEQKKRGKNYKAPEPGIQRSRNTVDNHENNEYKPELKRLYKEAIVKIHPDKISHYSEKEAIETATNLTAQLNKIYKNGDLDELKFFYYTISEDILISNSQSDNHSNTKEYEQVLIKAKRKLILEIESIKSSSLFYYLSANKQPQEFVDDLRERLITKIKKLEKRTKKIS